MMRVKKDILSGPLPALTPQDIVDFEPAIKEAVRAFLPFTSYSLFFPGLLSVGFNPSEPEYRADDNELILPLSLNDETLAFFVARGVKLSAPKAAPGYLMSLASAQLEKLSLYKSSITDPLTGLSDREHFLSTLARGIERIQCCMMPEAGEDTPLFTGSISAIVLDLDRFQWVNERYGYGLGDEVAKEVGQLIRSVCPKYATPARLINDRFGVLVPDTGPRACFQLAEIIRSGISKLSFADRITGDLVEASASLGYAGYPRDLSGPQLERTPAEQARIVLRKANQAMATAKARGRNRVFGFGDVLRSGGSVMEVLPGRRLVVGLGESVGARVGHRYLVREPRPGREVQARLTEEERLKALYPVVYKAEIVLMQVREDLSFAEVLHLDDPGVPIEPGDRLELVTEIESPFETDAGEAMPQPNPVTGLMSHSEFVSRWTGARAEPEAFAMALFKLQEPPRERAGSFQRYMDTQTRKVCDFVRTRAEAMGVAVEGEGGMFGGAWGLGGAVFHLPGLDDEQVMALMRDVVAGVREHHGLEVAAGSAVWPYLSFNRSDILENCRKALDHALLLDEPPLCAVFDSISMNISADRRFMEGDVYGAVAEYKLSLIADPANHLARNSLGTCHAQMGRDADARREFEAVLDADPSDLMALYNLGRVLERMGEADAAHETYVRCTETDPTHVFSLIRLGQMTERDKDFTGAEKYYRRAAQLPAGEPLTMRHLARLAMLREDKDQAREYLHQALQADHNDHVALNMLAVLYLDSGEDPQIAEVLARQASALAPDRNPYRDTLIRALKAQDKDEEAKEVAGRKRVV